jgi:molybdopterin-binding protein
VVLALVASRPLHAFAIVKALSASEDGPKSPSRYGDWVPASEMLAEVTLEVPRASIARTVTRAWLERLALELGRNASAFAKATELTLRP